ncbi:hypothetical protein LUW76_21430 [Actinomadura madurae]|uniref:hypothetical protein n=1 Tax=Actinomadura madurae TaxID=1993 RepID=UPI002026C133|nr:hypothetical protein [Actinomadura madurae]URM96691.1 hypothetical protein LUW76_21430 [Actinomadura madurae]URN07374.1 hypothetical protein LUW74_31240 [Actinomadura madurae]
MADTGTALDDDRLERLLPRAMARFRHRMFLGLRLPTRLGVAATAVSLGHDHAWAFVLAAVACAALDLRLAALLARRGGASTPVRLVMDLLDVVLWTLALGGIGDLTVLVAGPLILETAQRHGARALPLPVLAGASAMAATWFAAGRIDPLPFLWPAAAWTGGTLTRAYLRRRWLAEAAVMRDHLEAAVGRAELSGQNSVAMGADSVVDLLVRTAPLVTTFERDPEPLPFGAWKARLAEASGRQATYLGVALLRWQSLYNSRSPDLSADADLRPGPGAGTLLLSSAQTSHLEARLDALRPRGTVEVTVPRPGPAGAEQAVDVGGHRVVVPADARPRIRPVHAGPFAFVAAAVLTLTQSLPQWDGVPLWGTGPVALLALAAAWCAHRWTSRPAAEVAGRVMAIAVLLAAAESVLTSALMDPASNRLPCFFFLQWAVPLAVVHFRDLTGRGHALVVAGFAAAVLAGAVAMPVPFPFAGALLAVPWWIAPALAVHGLRDVLAEDSAHLQESLDRFQEQAVREGFRRGRRLVVELTEDAAETLRARCGALGPALPPEIAAEVGRRLDEARAMLSALPAD